MNPRHSLLRPLSQIEQAFTLSNDASPLSVVCVLHLAAGPEVAAVQAALWQLQVRYALLRAGIARSGGGCPFCCLTRRRPSR